MNEPANRPFAAGWIARSGYALLLVVLAILFFHEPLTSATFVFRDLYLLFFPTKLQLIDAIGSGQVPLWDSLRHGGQPFLASPAYAALYPLNVLFLFLPPIAAFNLFIVGHYLLGSLFTYALARRLQLSPLAALIAASVFAFNGYMLSLANLLITLLMVTWLPLVLLGLERFLDESHSRRGLILAVAAGVMQFLAGGGETILVTFALALVWGISRYGFRRASLAWILIVTFVAGLSLIRIVPVFEMMSESSRSGAKSFEAFAAWSVALERLPELAVPRFFGLTNTLSEEGYWGRNKEDEGFPYNLSLFFGPIALLLALTGGLARRPSESPRLRPFRLTLLAICATAVLLSLGKHLPGFQIVYEVVPGIGTFRFPVKALLLALLPLAILSGYGAETLFESEPKRGLSRRVGFAALTAGVVLGSVGLLLYGSRTFSEGFHQFFFSLDATDRSRALLVQSFLCVAATVMLFAGLAYGAPMRGKLRHLLIAALAGAELLIGGYGVNVYAPRDLFNAPPLVATVNEVRRGGRLYRAPVPAPYSIRAASDDITWIARFNLGILGSYTGAIFGIPVIFHDDYDGFAPSAIVTLKQRMEALDWSRRVPILAAAGVTAVITHENVSAPGLRFAGSLRNPSDRLFHLYAIDTPPDAWVSDSFQSVPSRAAALETMMSAGFDPVHSPVIETASGSRAEKPCTGVVRVVSRTMNSVLYQAESSCNAVVVFAEAHYPGWEVEIDGRAEELLRANYAFSAVRIPAGKHRIERRYRPRSLVRGLWGSLFFAALFGLTLTPPIFSRFTHLTRFR